MQRNRQLMSLWTAFICVFTLFLTPALAETDTEKLNYLALGDSLAHGTQHDQSNGEGYADFLAKQLDELGMLGNFSKAFAEPGHTAAGVLADITENKGENGVNIQTAIASADIITISAGVNDILRLLDLETFSYDQEEMKAGLESVGQNLRTVVSSIKSINPNANVYVMGYYNAFPYLPMDVQGNTILPLLSFLNDDIKQASHATGATYVRTDMAMEKDFETYLPNKEDIHPGKEGYLVLANCFWNRMDLGQEVEFTDEIPAWAQEEIDQLVAKGLIKGFEDGSFGAKKEVSRLHAAYIINRGVIFGDHELLDPGYHDISQASEGFDIVAKLSQNGVFEGDVNHNFNPDASLTRGQMAKITVEAFQLKADSHTIFTDVKGHWAEKYIQTLSAYGAIHGYPDHTFKPDQKITRAEFAKIISFVINPQIQEMPKDMPDDFGFSIQFGIGKRNEINTFNNTVTKDLINDGTVTVDVTLTNGELKNIYEKMRQINIVENKKLKPEPVNGIVCDQTPYEEDEWKMTMNGKTIIRTYSDKHCELTDDAKQLLEIRNDVLDIIKSKKEYKELPEPVGAYL